MTHSFHRSFRRGFSLIELLACMAIVGTLAAVSLPGLAGISSSGRMRQCVSQTASLLSQARMTAITQNTYVYLFFLTDTTKGRVETVMAYSRTGMNVYKDATGPLPATGADLALAHKPVVLDDVRLLEKGVVPASGANGIARPQPSAVMDLGMDYQLTLQSKTYNRCIVFRPNGEALIPPNAYTGLVEFALEPAQGASPSPRAAVVQVVGSTGQARVYQAQ